MSEPMSMSIPQKTQSIFFKHLPVIVTRHNLEEVSISESINFTYILLTKILIYPLS